MRERKRSMLEGRKKTNHSRRLYEEVYRPVRDRATPEARKPAEKKKRIGTQPDACANLTQNGSGNARTSLERSADCRGAGNWNGDCRASASAFCGKGATRCAGAASAARTARAAENGWRTGSAVGHAGL